MVVTSHSFRFSNLAVILFCVTGCASQGTNALKLHMSTNSESYILSAESIEVDIQFRNNKESPIVLHGCPSPPVAMLEQWNGYMWATVVEINILCIPPQSEQAIVEPGDSFSFTILVPDKGRFRVRMPVEVAPGSSVQMYSNEFEVTEPGVSSVRDGLTDRCSWRLEALGGSLRGSQLRG